MIFLSDLHLRQAPHYINTKGILIIFFSCLLKLARFSGFSLSFVLLLIMTVLWFPDSNFFLQDVLPGFSFSFPPFFLFQNYRN